MSMSRLKELREKRCKTHADAVVLLEKEQTAEIRTQVKAMLDEVNTIGEDIATIERADAVAKELAAGNEAHARALATVTDTDDPKVKAAAYRKAYSEFLLRGDGRVPRTTLFGGVSENSATLLNTVKRSMDAAMENREQRDQIAGTQAITYTQGAVGGYFVPAGFVNDVEVATKYFAPLLDGSVIRILETASGAILPYPTSNDTKQAWTIVGEGVQVTPNAYNTPNYATAGSAPNGFPGDVALGQVKFGAWKGTTGIIRVSLELMQDSAFNLETFLTEAFGTRLGRGYEYYLTNGTGTAQPLGILPAIAASGAVAVTAAGSAANDGGSDTGANSIGYQDLVNLTHSVDPSYRRGAKFMLHDATLGHLQTRLDKFGRPLWVPSPNSDKPDTLAGYPVVVNQSFPTIAPSAVSVAFGAWQKFIARKVRDLSVVRLDERFADFGEVGYVAFSRIDSNLVDAGTHPLNVLQQHS